MKLTSEQIEELRGIVNRQDVIGVVVFIEALEVPAAVETEEEAPAKKVKK